MRPPDAAIVDLVLPDGSGVEVCRAAARVERRCRSSCSRAVGEEDAKVEALDAGADDYVTKPFGPRELSPACRPRCAAPATGRTSRRSSADGLEIDLAARVVRRDGEEVHLTPIEFDLLRALARHRGRLMTHRALLIEVWGPQYADDTQVLRAHVANLRRKIEPPDGPRYIRTEPGVGYRFAA